MEEVTSELERWGYLLLGVGEDPDPDDHRVQKRAIVAGNKADADGALEEFQRLSDRYGDRFPVLMVSAVEEVGLDELTEAAFCALGKVRVYTKAPGEDPSYGSPVVLPQSSVVQDAAEALHKDWKRRLQYALLWGSGKFDSQRGWDGTTSWPTVMSWSFTVDSRKRRSARRALAWKGKWTGPIWKRCAA